MVPVQSIGDHDISSANEHQQRSPPHRCGGEPALAFVAFGQLDSSGCHMRIVRGHTPREASADAQLVAVGQLLERLHLVVPGPHVTDSLTRINQRGAEGSSCDQPGTSPRRLFNNHSKIWPILWSPELPSGPTCVTFSISDCRGAPGNAAPKVPVHRLAP